MSVIHVLVREARDLPNADKKSLSDGYVVIEVAGKKQKTKTVKDSLNPRWEEAFTFAPNGAQDIHFKVMDDDPVKDDFLGQCVVPVSRMPFEDWLPLTNKKNLPAGYLLVRVDDGREQAPQPGKQQSQQGNMLSGDKKPDDRDQYGHDRHDRDKYERDRYERDRYERDRYDDRYDRYERNGRRPQSKYDRLYDRYEGRRHQRYDEVPPRRYDDRHHDDRRYDDRYHDDRRHDDRFDDRRYDRHDDRRHDDRRYDRYDDRRHEDRLPPRRHEDWLSSRAPPRYGGYTPSTRLGAPYYGSSVSHAPYYYDDGYGLGNTYSSGFGAYPGFGSSYLPSSYPPLTTLSSPYRSAWSPSLLRPGFSAYPGTYLGSSVLRG